MEKTYSFTVTDEKVIERIMEDENAAINHMVLPEGEGLPVHTTNSNVYMIVVRGGIHAALNEGPDIACGAGTILNIPYLTKMDVRNRGKETAELFVVKAPAPLALAREICHKKDANPAK
jgi:mannose-6-phosphate isomerase-like protein (cupin superfamily)